MKELIRLFKYAQNLRHYVVLIAVASIITSLLAMVMPFVIKFATDHIVAMVSGTATQDEAILFWLIGGLVLAQIVSVIISSISGYFGDIFATKMRRQLSERYYEHLLTLPQKYYDEATTGKIINRLSRAIVDVTQFLNMFANSLLQMLLVVFISIGVMLWYSWPIALVVLIQLPIYLYLTARTSKKWQVYEEDKNTELDIASGRFAEVVGQMRLVKSFGAQSQEAVAFRKRYKKVVNLTKKQSNYWHTMDFWRSLVRVFVYGVVFTILFLQAAHGQLSVGDMMLLITLVQQTSLPLEGMSFFIDIYQRAVANSKDYAEAMAEQPEEIDEKSKNTLETKQATVEFRDVDFAYSDKKKVLKKISFSIDAGMKVALVGESGGGKSTISNLLMQLYRPQSGQIFINDEDLANLTQASIRSNIATVFQEASLFSGTIRENIAYGRPGAPEEELIAAAKAANAYNFITELKKSFDTEIGERGIKLSGGQKQRIAIARALLKDSPILILDEATSSLDSRSEHEVQKALDRLMKGRTTLIIAHRLSTIAGVDRIVTLKNGQVDEIGSPKQLAKTDGLYATLLELQKSTDKEKLAKYDIRHGE